MRLMAVIPFSRAGSLVDGQRLAICVDVVNGEEGQVGAGFFVIRSCRVEGHASSASAFDNVYELAFKVFW